MRRIIMALSLLACAGVIFGTSFANAQESPQVKKRVDPFYPDLLKLAGIEGEVEVRAFVNAQGYVEKVEAVKSSNPAFVPQTLEAVKQWEFIPATKEGKPVRAEVVIPFEFRLGAAGFKSRHEALFALQEAVASFIRGDSGATIMNQIGEKSYAVIGNRSEKLSSVVGDQSKRALVVEGRHAKVTASSTIIGQSDDSAVSLVKSSIEDGKKIRYHTLVYMRTPDGQWKIQAWHVSP